MSKRASLRSKKSKPVQCGRVTHVAVSRLYNLGNYQNIKFDLGAEVAAGQSASETLRRLHMILTWLEPHHKPDCLNSLKEIEGKTQEELSEWQKGHIKEWRDEAASYALKRMKVTEALQALDDLGGHSVFRDAKDTWQHDDDPMF